LNLLVDAEQFASEAREKRIAISSGALARRVLVEIAYQTRSAEFQKVDGADGPSGHGALGLGVCRAIVQSHGGDFRAVRISPTQARFEIELPLAGREPAALGPSGGSAPRQLTVLLVEPDVRVQRQLVRMLSDRGDRVVPVASAEEGGDMTLRMRFDIALCAMRLPGLNWLEFFERVRRQVGAFALLTEGFDADLARVFQGGEGFVLSKPVDEAELQRVCRSVEERAMVRGA
jgi:CheY-like chemotaxis protein